MFLRPLFHKCDKHQGSSGSHFGKNQLASNLVLVYPKIRQAAARNIPTVQGNRACRFSATEKAQGKGCRNYNTRKANAFGEGEDTGTDTTGLEFEIDHLVYTLYGLTLDEIRFVVAYAPSSIRRAEPASDPSCGPTSECMRMTRADRGRQR